MAGGNQEDEESSCLCTPLASARFVVVSSFVSFPFLLYRRLCLCSRLPCLVCVIYRQFSSPYPPPRPPPRHMPSIGYSIDRRTIIAEPHPPVDEKGVWAEPDRNTRPDDPAITISTISIIIIIEHQVLYHPRSQITSFRQPPTRAFQRTTYYCT